jgi:hypothetical protein
MQVRDLVKRWSMREPGAVKKVDEILATMQLTMDDVAARAIEVRIGSVERLEAMLK